MIPLAWARRHSLQVGPVRRGAGPSRAVLSTERIVGPTRIPSLRSSPSIRTQPQRGVLPGQPEDERTDRGIDRWPAWATALRVGPLPAHELAVPTEERCRGDEKGDPAVTRQDATRRREQDTVARTQPRWAGRPLQHLELVAEDEDLEVLGSVGATRLSGADEETDGGADDEVEERPHRPIVPGDPSANRDF